VSTKGAREWIVWSATLVNTAIVLLLAVATPAEEVHVTGPSHGVAPFV